MIHQTRELLRTNAANQSKSHQALTYLIRLISWNYHEGLLNCELFLTKMVDLLHDTSSKLEELCLILSVLLEYIPDICKLSKHLSVKLVNFCYDKISQVRNHYSISLFDSIHIFVTITFFWISMSFRWILLDLPIATASK